MAPKTGLIYRGAEAELWRSEYLGLPAVEKRRVKKKWRNQVLDQRLRSERIKKEARMLLSARRAMNTPLIYDVDLENCALTMEFLDGTKVRDLFYKNELVREVSVEAGRAVRRLHGLGIAHGDITTSNMIYDEKNSRLSFIDFGLAQRASRDEDRAVDLLVFKRMVKSTHWSLFDEIWGSFCGGYGDEKTLDKVKEIEKRARYL
ncbi:MAG: KEOPS complex kinase/ATPase Bud32 [Candidatus Micrarchaeota archaeon]